MKTQLLKILKVSSYVFLPAFVITLLTLPTPLCGTSGACISGGPEILYNAPMAAVSGLFVSVVLGAVALMLEKQNLISLKEYGELDRVLGIVSVLLVVSMVAVSLQTEVNEPVNTHKCREVLNQQLNAVGSAVTIPTACFAHGEPTVDFLKGAEPGDMARKNGSGFEVVK